MKARNETITELDKKIFINNLYKIGYSKKLNKKNINILKILTFAFQRRFRQDIINGIIDKECLIISENIAKKFK